MAMPGGSALRAPRVSVCDYAAADFKRALCNLGRAAKFITDPRVRYAALVPASLDVPTAREARWCSAVWGRDCRSGQIQIQIHVLAHPGHTWIAPDAPVDQV